MENIDYVFKCGITAHQHELTLKQDGELAKLLSKLNVSNFDLSKISILELIAHLVEDNILNDALNIILNTQNEDYSELTNSELEKVITDFFTLNPSLKKLFSAGKSEQAG